MTERSRVQGHLLELGESSVMQVLQFQQGCRHIERETHARMATGVVQQVMHQIREVLMPPEQFDFFPNRWEGIRDNTIVFLKFTHDQGLRCG